MIGKDELARFNDKPDVLYKKVLALSNSAQAICTGFKMVTTPSALIVRKALEIDTPSALNDINQVVKKLKEGPRFRFADYPVKQVYISTVNDLGEIHSTLLSSMIWYINLEIEHYRVNFTDISCQTNLNELPRFVDQLPLPEADKHSFRDKMTAAKELMEAHNRADDKDKDKIVRQQNEKLMRDHEALVTQNDKAKAELVLNQKLLGELTGKKHDLEESLPSLNKKAEKLRTEEHELSEKIRALQKEIGSLQAGVDVARGHREEGKVAFILEAFTKDIEKMKPKTQEVAKALAKKFKEYANTYFKSERKEENQKSFIRSCREAVSEVKPTLDDIGFWRKVQNMLTALWNAITPAAKNINFFQSELAKKTETALSDLDTIHRLKT